MKEFIPQKLINNIYHKSIAVLANIKYNFPSKRLKIIGVTGTDGKTTTVTMIYNILKSAGKKVAYISTVKAKLGDKEIDTGFHVTTPNSYEIQKLLKKIAEEGFEWVIIEATSHGLEQNRLWGIKYDICVFTNITHEHLDYHSTFDNYIKAKSKLIENSKSNAKIILNIDDKTFFKLQEISIKLKRKVITYSIYGDSDFYSSSIKSNFKGLEYTLNHPNGSNKINIPIIGEYNISNSLAAISAVYNIVNISNITDTLSNFHGILGRMQIMQISPFKIIIDFAHTPNALKLALESLKKLKEENARLFVVFGCAGLRDKQKRYLMGEIASKLANVIIITAEDPRTENLKDINDEIEKGIIMNSCLAGRQAKFKILNNNLKLDDHETKRYIRFDQMDITSRINAINYAINNAKQKDIIIICGKGHEKSLCFDKQEYDYTDQKTVKDIISLK